MTLNKNNYRNYIKEFGYIGLRATAESVIKRLNNIDIYPKISK